MSGQNHRSSMDKPMKYIGTSVEREGVKGRVTGELKFTGDMRFKNMLHVKLVRIDCPRAKILSIDTEAAYQVDGVVYIMTDADIPDPMPRFGPFVPDQPVIATKTVNFYGEPVAAVIAETEDAAAYAASLVKVDYEPLPGVYTVEQALAPDAPLVQDPSIREDNEYKNSNVYYEWKYGWGEPQQVEADLFVEDTFNFPMTVHFAIEPHVFIGAPEDDGVVIYSTVQHPFLVQRELARVLQLPISKVRIVSPELGGAFGGKGYPKFEALMAFIALKLKRPARLLLSMDEVFQLVRRTSAAVHIKAGFEKSGKLVSMVVNGDFLIGAYADATPRIVSKASYAGCGVFRPDNVSITGRAIFSNTLPGTAFRGFGAPQYMWAIDSIMDLAAKKLELDRLDIRVMNIVPKGEQLVPGDNPVDGEWADDLKKAAAAIDWGTPLTPGHGRGLGIGIKTPAPATVSQAMVRLHYDGSLRVLVGTTEMGQGSRTVMGQIAADNLGVDLDKVRVISADTSLVPYDAITASSRSTVFMGNAVVNACADLVKRLKPLVAETYSVEEGLVTIDDGEITVGDQVLSYSEFMRQYFGPNAGELIGFGTYKEPILKDHPLKGNASFWEVIMCAVEVEVDQETGQVFVRKLATVGDVGKAINPLQVKGQDEGGAIMGLGHSLMEQLVIDEHGIPQNASALDYRIPTIMDIPDEMITILVENQDGSGPEGAKGTGESGIIPVGAAIGLAVADATGVVFHDLPLTPERVWQALHA
jgi:CO/xanthine dehydrogenase Mo-binding subunit